MGYIFGREDFPGVSVWGDADTPVVSLWPYSETHAETASLFAVRMHRNLGHDHKPPFRHVPESVYYRFAGELWEANIEIQPGGDEPGVYLLALAVKENGRVFFCARLDVKRR